MQGTRLRGGKKRDVVLRCKPPRHIRHQGSVRGAWCLVLGPVLCSSWLLAICYLRALEFHPASGGISAVEIVFRVLWGSEGR